MKLSKSCTFSIIETGEICKLNSTYAVVLHDYFSNLMVIFSLIFHIPLK